MSEKTLEQLIDEVEGGVQYLSRAIRPGLDGKIPTAYQDRLKDTLAALKQIREKTKG